jgi:hypothetical protein
LKRWKDGKLTNNNVPSIALTCAAYNWFSYKSEADGSDFDLQALLQLIRQMKSNVINTAGVRWLTIYLPVIPNNDLLDDLTEIQMNDFLDRLDELETTLVEAKNHPDQHEASKLVAKQLVGFPVPEKKDNAEKAATFGYITTGQSA